MKEFRRKKSKLSNETTISTSTADSNSESGSSKPLRKNRDDHLIVLWILGGFLAIFMLICLGALMAPTQIPATVPDNRAALPRLGVIDAPPALSLSHESSPLQENSSSAPDDDSASADPKTDGKDFDPQAQRETREFQKSIDDRISGTNIQLVLKLHERVEHYGDLRKSRHASSEVQKELEKRFSSMEREIYGFMRERWEGLLQKGRLNPIDDETVLKEAAEKFGITADKAKSIFIDIDSYIFFGNMREP